MIFCINCEYYKWTDGEMLTECQHEDCFDYIYTPLTFEKVRKKGYEKLNKNNDCSRHKLGKIK